MTINRDVNVKQNLKNIENEIKVACEKANRNVNEITLIAVTKYVTIERTKEAVEAGIMNIGENRIEGLLEKKSEIQNDINWHFIGTLQSRKVRDVVNEVDYIHSLDRKSLAKEINKRTQKPINCFVQVNVSGEESKQGLDEHTTLEFIRNLADYSNIRVCGLMTMAPFVEDEEVLRNTFKKLSKLRNEVKAANLSHAPCEDLSIGMSNDFKIAIEEGATHIRIGTDLVGSELKR